MLLGSQWSADGCSSRQDTPRDSPIVHLVRASVGYRRGCRQLARNGTREEIKRLYYDKAHDLSKRFTNVPVFGCAGGAAAPIIKPAVGQNALFQLIAVVLSVR
jgi:hypothetical protein